MGERKMMMMMMRTSGSGSRRGEIGPGEGNQGHVGSEPGRTGRLDSSQKLNCLFFNHLDSVLQSMICFCFL